MNKIEVLEVKQPIGVFYITKIKASVLLEIVEADPYRITSEMQRIGTQRPEDRKRIGDISEFLKGVESTLPNSIIIAGNTNPNAERWEVTKEGNQLFLSFQEKVINGTIIDGQHRLKGFKLLPNEIIKDFDLICSIYLDLPNPYQAYIFATINMNQKKVDKSLAYELYGYNLDDDNPNTWSPEKLAVYLSRKLNFDKESIFYNRIIIAAENDNILYEISPKNNDWYISTASIVDGILLLISSNPKRDRDLLQQLDEKNRKRSSLKVDNAPLRNYYLESNDKLIYTIIKNFFNASYKTLFKKGSYLFKTVGIQAQFGLLKIIIDQYLIKHKNIGEIYYTELLANCVDIDFSDNFFTASGLGKSRILNTLQLKLKLKDLLDIRKVDDVDDYHRIANL